MSLTAEQGQEEASLEAAGAKANVLLVGLSASVYAPSEPALELKASASAWAGVLPARPDVHESARVRAASKHGEENANARARVRAVAAAVGGKAKRSVRAPEASVRMGNADPRQCVRRVRSAACRDPNAAVRLAMAWEASQREASLAASSVLVCAGA